MSTPDPNLVAFREILDNFNRAWEASDAHGWVKYLEPECDFMQAFGRYCPDRESTEQFLAGFLGLQAGGIRVREVEVRIRYITPTLALVEQTIEASGVRNTDGSHQPARRGHLMIIVRRGPDGWRIAHYRFCDLHTQPLRTTEPSQPAIAADATFRDGHQGAPTNLAISPDEKWLVSTDPTGRLVFWDLQDLFGRQPAAVADPAGRADSPRLACSVADDGTILIRGA